MVRHHALVAAALLAGCSRGGLNDGRDLAGAPGDLAAARDLAQSGPTDSAVGPARSRIGVFRDGTWTIDANDDRSWEPNVDTTFVFGAAGDLPVTGDWNGDGRYEIGVFRVVNGAGQFTLDWDGDGKYDPQIDKSFTFGLAGDRPVVGDWSGTGKTRIATLRPTQPNNATWSIDVDGDFAWNPNVDKVVSYGLSGDLPVAGDWTGSGTARIGIFRPVQPNNAIWDLDVDGDFAWNAPPDREISFGLAADLPAPGDWNGDGRAKLATYRGGVWSFDTDGDGAYDASATFGGPTDRPVVLWR